MKISKRGIDFIKKWEGKPHLTAWRFGNEKYLSIGYGHYGDDVKPGQTISESEAERLLLKDISGAEKNVNSYDHIYHFTQSEYDALTSFAYNIGSINQLTAKGTRNKKEIADKMLLYNKSCGKVLAGLTNRRKAERELFLSGSINNGGNKFMIDNEMPVISHGSTGAVVGTLQILLKYKGYKGSNGKVLSIDNCAGNNTIYAIKSFQRKNNLAPDGYCGPATWRKILKG